MLKVDWIGHGIVIVDNGEPNIRYLDSNFLRDTGISAEAEEAVRTLFDKHNAVNLEIHPGDGRWNATASIEVDAWTVVSHAGEGDTIMDALRNLICNIIKKD